MYFLSVILIGTVYPIFLEVIAGEKISVGPPFFNKLIIPFLIPFLIFMSIGPNLKWIKNNNFKKKINLIYFFVLNLILSVIILKIFGKITLNFTILLAAGLYLFFVTLKDFFKKEFKKKSQIISHFGFSLLVLSILINSILSKEITINLQVGEKINFMKNTIKFKKIENSSASNYKSLIAYFEIENNNKKIFLKPEIRIYNQPKMITSEAAIKTDLFKDRFLVVNLVKGDNYFNVRYQEKPLMIWIWFSTILIASGGILIFFKKNEK